MANFASEQNFDNIIRGDLTGKALFSMIFSNDSSGGIDRRCF